MATKAVDYAHADEGVGESEVGQAEVVDIQDHVAETRGECENGSGAGADATSVDVNASADEHVQKDA